MKKNKNISVLLTVVVIMIIANVVLGQQRLEWERWGNFGVGKLVTRMSNTNNIGSGRLKYPEIAKFPAFEYPYNADAAGRHVYYAVGVSFHVGGYTMDRGPAWDRDPNSFDLPLLESGDQASYKFYKGFHFDSFPDFIASSGTAPIPLSDNQGGWPQSGWPATYPTTDPVLQRLDPNYPTVYNQGMAEPIPILLDTLLGFPGAGPNKFSAPGLYYPGKVVADQESFTVSFAKNRDLPGNSSPEKGHLMIYTTLRGLSWKGELAEDILFWVLSVTNIGTLPIDSTYVGMFADFDFPWGSFQEFGTYSKVDAFAFDTYAIDEETGREHKIAYGWDGDGDVTGATAGNWPYLKAKLTDETPVEKVALAGVVFLQTPIDTLSNQNAKGSLITIIVGPIWAILFTIAESPEIVPKLAFLNRAGIDFLFCWLIIWLFRTKDAEIPEKAIVDRTFTEEDLAVLRKVPWFRQFRFWSSLLIAVVVFLYVVFF